MKSSFVVHIFGRALTGFFAALSLLGAGLFLLVLFFVGTRSSANWLGNFNAAVVQNYPVELVAALALTLGGYLLFNVFRVRKEFETKPGSAAEIGWRSDRWIYVNGALSIFIFLRVLFSLNSPLDVDENVHAHELSSGAVWTELDPLHSDPQVSRLQNHVLSQFFSFVSVKIFGLNKIAFRLPALLFTLLLLLVINLGARGAVSPIAVTLLLVHFGGNEMVSWYLHSTRGYVGMIVFTLLPLLLVLRYVVGQKPTTRFQLGLFALSLGLSAFTHLFAMLFNVLLLFALLVWLNRQRLVLENERYRIGKKILLIGLVLAPLFALIAGSNLLLLQRMGDLGAQATEQTHPLIGFMGFAYYWQFKLFALLITGLALAVGFRKIALNFTTLFLISTLGFFALAVPLLHVRILEPRFFLAFLSPLIFWVADLATRPLSPQARAGAMGVAFVAFGLLPALSARAIHADLSINVADFDHFIRAARKLTAPVKENCYSFSGKLDLTLWAQDFYFSDAGREKCRAHFHLEISPRVRDANMGEVPAGDRSVVFRQNDMVLYRFN